MSAQPALNTLSLIDPAAATGAQKEILDKATKQVGYLPNMYKAMANAPAVLDTYLYGYALFRSESGLTPAEQEVVFLAISRVNECHYCVAAHSMIADKRAGVPADVLAAIRSGQPIPDGRLAALYAIAAAMVRTQGQPSADVVQAFLKAGFEDRHYLYVVLAVAIKTLSNFTNHAFDTPLDAGFASYRTWRPGSSTNGFRAVGPSDELEPLDVVGRPQVFHRCGSCDNL